MRTLRRTIATALAAALVTTGVTVGSATPAAAAPPFGVVDFIGTAADGHIDVVGWAINPNNPSQPVNIGLYLMENPNGGWFFGMQMAELYRADVGATYPQYGPYHGFNLSTRNDAGGVEIGPSIDPENPGQFIFPGTYDLCVSATTGYATTQLGCRPVTITQQILSLYWP